MAEMFSKEGVQLLEDQIYIEEHSVEGQRGFFHRTYHEDWLAAV